VNCNATVSKSDDEQGLGEPFYNINILSFDPKWHQSYANYVEESLWSSALKQKVKSRRYFTASRISIDGNLITHGKQLVLLCHLDNH
jgi:hypothetical protein